MALITIGRISFDKSKIFAVAMGEWSNSQQDCKAVIISLDGGRVQVDAFYKGVVEMLGGVIDETPKDLLIELIMGHDPGVPSEIDGQIHCYYCGEWQAGTEVKQHADGCIYVRAKKYVCVCVCVLVRGAVCVCGF